MDGHWCHRWRAAGPGRVRRAGARGQPAKLSLDDGDECSCDALVGAVRGRGGIGDGDCVAGWAGGSGEGCGDGSEGGLVAVAACLSSNSATTGGLQLSHPSFGRL